MRIRGVHIRVFFVACIVGIVAYVANRQYFLSTPAGKVESYLSFLTDADQVQILATTRPPDQNDPTLDPRKVAVVVQPGSSPPNYLEKQTEVPFGSRPMLVQFLKDITGNKGVTSGTFEPHYFIFAQKAGKHIRIAISFSGGQAQFSGDLPSASSGVFSSSAQKAVQVFGIDIEPELQRLSGQ